MAGSGTEVESEKAAGGVDGWGGDGAVAGAPVGVVGGVGDAGGDSAIVGECSAAVFLAPEDVVGGVDRAAVIEIAGD